jgi:3-methyl-2-oxobutanoate hydroxymethyltransferase
MSDKITIEVLGRKKESGEKITALTSYDASAASRVEKAGIDLILVGDSVGMTLLGYETTLPVTIEDVLHHTKAVSRGISRCLLVADMPFLSFGVEQAETIRNAGRLVKEGGASAVKLEGGEQIIDEVKALIRAGIPVMGHVGLSPQHILLTGRYSVQGKKKSEANQVLKDAESLQRAGAFAIVLECVPSELAKEITKRLTIPVIGIGADPYCDGQIMVTHDLLGLTEGRRPKFVKTYVNLAEQIDKALECFNKEVKEGSYPDKDHSYWID